jgi:hypothetical protein
MVYLKFQIVCMQERGVESFEKMSREGKIKRKV